MNTRKAKIQMYESQLALTVALMEIAKADLENEAMGEDVRKANEILGAMREAGYAPRRFGADTLETGDETPEQIEEYWAAQFA